MDKNVLIKMMKHSHDQMVTVVITFLNEERFLAEAIESVIHQKYTNWEIILVDDGSSDKSTDIAKKYASQSKGKIIYTEHEAHSNKGLSASRNHGISLAKGSLLTFLDADDIWLPLKLQVQVSLMNQHPDVSMLCEASYWWHSWHGKYYKDVIVKVGKQQDKVFYPPSLLEELYPLSSGAAPCPSGIMIRTETARKYGGFEAHFTGKYQLYEDQGFLHKIYLSEPVYISSACNNKYRQRQGSLMREIKEEGSYDNVRTYFLSWLQQYMAGHQIKNQKVDELIEKAFEKLRNRSTPLISVVTPFMNEEQYIRETIESVINQTYTNWEYLLIDDGSSDNSTQIAKEYAEKYKGKIFYFQHNNHENRGVCASRNLGVKMASGDHLCFLDADDLWLPKKLEMQVGFLNEYPEAHMICEATHYMNKGRNPNVENIDVPVGVPGEKLYQPPSLVFKLYPLGKGDAVSVGSFMIAKNFVETIGGFEETFIGRYSFYEDQAFLIKVYYHATVYVSSACNNIYRQRVDSSMHSSLSAGNYRAGRTYFLAWLKNYLKNQYVQYPAVNAFYKKIALSYNHPRIYKLTYGVFFKLRDIITKSNKGKK